MLNPTRILSYLLTLLCLSSASQAEDATVFVELPPQPAGVAEVTASATTHVGGLSIRVHMATEPAMQEGNYEEWLSIMKAGTGVGAEWLVLPDPRLIFSAALLIPSAAIGYAVEKGTWERVYTALTTFGISRHIADSLERRLKKRYANSTTPSGQIDVKINALGLDGDPNSQLCLILQCNLVLNLNDVGRFVRKISVTKGNREHGEPPPQCADIDRFEDRNAQLVRDTLREYSEIAAFLAVQFISVVAEQ